MDKEGVAQQKAKSAKISYKIKIFAIHLTNLTLSFIIKYGYYYTEPLNRWLARACGLQGGIRPTMLVSREEVGNVRTVEGGRDSRLATEKSSWSATSTDRTGQQAVYQGGW